MGPDYQQPQADIPPGWRVEYPAAADLANTAWWENFQDPVINDLIKTALNENKDLLIAAARVEEFAARVQATQADLYPQLYYGGSAGRRQESEELKFPFGDVLDRTNSKYEAFLSAGWELDIWGRIRRSTEAARAELLATEEGRQAVILTLVSAVAGGYVDLLGLDKQLEIARKTLAFRQEWLRLFEAKKKGGQISELELIQVRESYEQAATVIPIFQRQIALQENYLSVLLGRNPGPISRGKTLDTLVMPEVPQGIPSDVLVRRPDIRQSEQNLVAANAQIGVARTLYFPSISLTGLFGFASSSLSNLPQSSANVWEVAGGFIGPIFAGGRIKSENLQAEARYKQLLYDYLKTIQTAFKEVNDSLVSRQNLVEQSDTLQRLVGTLEDYSQFSRKSYEAGYASYLTVLDADEKLYVALARYTQNQNDSFSAMVNIYKAMGGGWVTEADKLTVAPAQQTEPKVAKN
jgi:multidrug efflux system outer membrane protein